MTTSRWRAPAKVNLTLHILGRRDDGYHELDSAVAFAGACDWLEFWPDGGLSLEVWGPTAAAAGGAGENLVIRAAQALANRRFGLRLGRFRLFKALPVAAGLGGGSSDAAAALRALAWANGLALDHPDVLASARATGADVPVCLEPRMRMMAGIGERVEPPLGLGGFPAVLVNPGVAVSTPAVFAGIGLARGAASGWGASPRLRADGVFAALARGRNDMQASAEALAPAITEALALLATTDGARIVRMSGSGATCFALYDTRGAAARAARAMRARRPDWWVRSTWLR